MGSEYLKMLREDEEFEESLKVAAECEIEEGKFEESSSVWPVASAVAPVEAARAPPISISSTPS